VTTWSNLARVVEARATLPSPAERRRLRIDAGITVKSLAQVLGISVSAMNSLERAENPGEKYLVDYVNALNTMRRPAPEPALTTQEAAELREQWEKSPCGACGGLHVTALKTPGACPRIKRIAYDAQGRMLEVEYWPDGKWPKDGIIWPDGIMAEE